MTLKLDYLIAYLKLRTLFTLLNLSVIFEKPDGHYSAKIECGLFKGFLRLNFKDFGKTS